MTPCFANSKAASAAKAQYSVCRSEDLGIATDNLLLYDTVLFLTYDD